MTSCAGGRSASLASAEHAIAYSGVATVEPRDASSWPLGECDHHASPTPGGARMDIRSNVSVSI
jgi:hypothetical protein